MDADKSESFSKEVFMRSRIAQVLFVVLLVMAIVAMTTIPAEAGSRRSSEKGQLQASMGWRGGQAITLSSSSGSDLGLSLADGFEFACTYRFFSDVHLGLVLTNYARSSGAERASTASLSKTQLGIVGNIASPWTQLSRKYQRWHYCGKIGGVFDAWGLKVESARSQAEDGDIEVGRVREHRFFASFELGFKCFGTENTGILFARLSYARSIYSFSSSISTDYRFGSGSNDHIYFDIGISI